MPATAMMGTMQMPSEQGHGDGRPIAPTAWPTQDRGSFTHGVCRSCTWLGPGRRSRALASTDAKLHSLAGCDASISQAL